MQNNFRIALITLLIAFMLAMMPLPEWAVNFRPDWVTLALIYWVMASPATIGVTVAWLVGLMLDVTHGAILGQHAIGLVMVSYIVLLQHQRLRVASLVQQSLVILILLLLKQLLVLWVDGIVDQSADIWVYFAPAIVGTLLWPWLFIIMDDTQRKFA